MPSTQTVGSLLVDLRASTASFKADMAEASKAARASSREMSNAIRQDTTEARQTLALMREDFGVAIPRELRSTIAQVSVLREAIVGLRNVFVGLAFLNIGIEAGRKLWEVFTAGSEEAKRKTEAAEKAEKDFLEAVKTGNADHAERLRLIGLIGKNAEEVYKSNKAHNQELINDQKEILQGMINQINAKQAQMLLDIAAAKQSQDALDKTGEVGQGPQFANYIQGLRDELNTFTQDLMKPIEEGRKKIKALEDEGLRLTKQHEQDRRDEYKKTADSALQKLNEFRNKELELLDPLAKVRVEWENIRALQAAILAQHPELVFQAVGTLSAEIAARQKLIADSDREALAALRESTAEMQKQMALQSSGILGGLVGSLQPRGLPQLAPDMLAAAMERFSSELKNAAAQGQLLTKAMDDLLSPADKFRAIQRELELLKEKYANYPKIIKALNEEIQRANPEFERMKNASREFARDLTSELDRAIFQTESWSDALKNILKDLAEIILRYEVLEPLARALSGDSNNSNGGSTGFLGSLLGGLFGGGRAGGGPVDPGHIYMVGEHGPEPFIPGMSGTILPHGAIGGTSVQNFFDFRGADASALQKIERAVVKLAEQTPKIAVAAMQNYSSRR